LRSQYLIQLLLKNITNLNVKHLVNGLGIFNIFCKIILEIVSKTFFHAVKIKMSKSFENFTQFLPFLMIWILKIDLYVKMMSI